MSKEQDIINKFLHIMPHSGNQINDYYESDAEIITINKQKTLFTLDEFSAEDFFRDHDAYTLGWNVVACTISDIFASGGNPTYFAHSMAVNPDQWKDNYVERFAEGMSDVLNQVECSFIGGDTGFSENWHYTGVAIGETNMPVTRKGAKEGDRIYITGSVGIGNLEAALKIYSKNFLIGNLAKKLTLRFPVRYKESQTIKKYATSCIDTSDGLVNALNTVAAINSTGYKIMNIPYNSKGTMACRLLKKPIAMLLLGECGEYELLFTIDREKEQHFLDDVKNQGLEVTKLGVVTHSDKEIVFNDNKINISDFDIKARDFKNIEDYLSTLSNYAQKLN